MTHVLDRMIAALEGDIRDIRKYGPGVCDPNDDSRSDAVSMVRSKAAALRILRAERDSPSARGREIESRAREAAVREVAGHRAAGREVYGRPISSKLERHHMEALMGKTLDEIRSEERVEREDELRAEGRREEREQLVDIGDEMAAMLDMATSLSDIDSEGAVTELLAEWRSARGDHWRGGEG